MLLSKMPMAILGFITIFRELDRLGHNFLTVAQEFCKHGKGEQDSKLAVNTTISE
jgi:hypothetical protein